MISSSPTIASVSLRNVLSTRSLVSRVGIDHVGEPGGNRTHNPQIKSRFPILKTFKRLSTLARRLCRTCHLQAMRRNLDATEVERMAHVRPAIAHGAAHTDLASESSSARK